jgi:hypothetical protein
MAETVRFLRVEVKVSTVVVGDDGAKLQKTHVYDKTFSDGTSSNQVGNVWNDDSRSLAATSEELNLDGVSDFQGVATGFTNVKVMMIENLDEDTGDKITIGGAASNAFVNMFVDATDKMDIGPGGLFLYVNPVDGAAITAGTGDLLKVEAVDTSTYKILVSGDNA